MTYTSKYTPDDLFDMFANQADIPLLAKQAAAEVEQQLRDLAPDMEDAGKVAAIIQGMANDRDYKENQLPEIRKKMAATPPAPKPSGVFPRRHIQP